MDLVEDPKKGADGKGDPKGDDGKTPEVDPKIAEIQKDPDAVQNLLAQKRAANEEAKKLRLKLEEFEKTQKAAADKALEEQGKFKELAEKHKAEAEAAKEAVRALNIRYALQLEAVAAGAVDADDVVRLSDTSALKVGDDGKVEGAAELVAALKKSKPHLFRDGDETPPVPPGGPPASLRKIAKPADNDKISPVGRIARGLAKAK